MSFCKVRLQQLLTMVTILISSVVVCADNVDLELTVEKTPQGLTPPGTGGTLTFSVTNHGSDTAINHTDGGIGGIGSEDMPIYDPYNEQLPLLLQGTDQSDCLVQLDFVEGIPPNPIKFFWNISLINPISPGDTRVCNVEYLLNDVSRMDSYFFDFEWGVWTVTETDTNPDNNIASNRYFFANPPPAGIPTLSTVGYVILALLMMILTWNFRHGTMIKVPKVKW